MRVPALKNPQKFVIEVESVWSVRATRNALKACIKKEFPRVKVKYYPLHIAKLGSRKE